MAGSRCRRAAAATVRWAQQMAPWSSPPWALAVRRRSLPLLCPPRAPWPPGPRHSAPWETAGTPAHGRSWRPGEAGREERGEHMLVPIPMQCAARNKGRRGWGQPGLRRMAGDPAAAVCNGHSSPHAAPADRSRPRQPPRQGAVAAHLVPRAALQVQHIDQLVQQVQLPLAQAGLARLHLLGLRQ